MTGEKAARLGGCVTKAGLTCNMKGVLPCHKLPNDLPRFRPVAPCWPSAPAAAAAALAAGGAVNILATATARPSSDDPIFAVIAEHRAHMRAWADAMEAQEVAESDAEFEDATDAIGAASEVFEASIGLVLTTQPTTIAGVATLLHHVGQHEFLGMDQEYEDVRQTVLTTWLNVGLGDERKRIAQEFPLRIAATLRSLLDKGAQT
jgi:hypothetical protein